MRYLQKPETIKINNLFLLPTRPTNKCKSTESIGANKKNKREV